MTRHKYQKSNKKPSKPTASEKPDRPEELPFSTAELGAIAHLYRGEVYRSTIWRTRLDNTTNWAVVTLGIALSISFSGPAASPLPLLMVGFLVILFLLMEARRYRYFNVWRARARWIETHFYAPMLHDGPKDFSNNWRAILAADYCEPGHHITYLRAVGRRLRRNYAWILIIQALSYFGKVLIHPTPLTSIDQLWERAAVGPVPGELVVLGGVVFNFAWISVAALTFYFDHMRYRSQKTRIAMG